MRPRVRLHLESLEERLPLAADLVPAVAAGIVAPAEPNWGAILDKRITLWAGRQVGSGECTDLATEYLREAGARFAWTVGTHSYGYAWGRLLGGITSWRDYWRNDIHVGDVLQFVGAVWPTGHAIQHTAIVSAVRDGWPVAVFHQNWDGRRQAFSMPIDLHGLSRGMVRAYRPLVRLPSIHGIVQFTITNRSGAPVHVQEWDGTRAYNYWLTPNGTTGSYQVRVWSGVHTLRLIVGSGNGGPSSGPLVVEDRKALTIQDSTHGPKFSDE